ncbi:apolipoprotein D-like [Mizuhopecten yessoensis]|uniref:Apolipoprotein D n=1 Tax=Mizuhopecten yessoensis TaxID=6573 RepID=A0A210R2K7_MIZYE|nr:apolipoprotein D-like [Mizuhopecten yessoensis]OWF55136.1 Apolipoprotein D [Mizuhopecten yessoensis]
MLGQGLILAVVVAFTSAQTFSFGHCPTSTTQQSFDLNRYIGDWYELYKFRASFETGEKCIVANYTLTPANHIKVKNTGIDPKTGNYSIAYGDAFQGDLNSPAKLKIRFAANTPYGNYWVLKTDYTSYTLIYSCTDILGLSHLEFAWILSRQRSLPQAKIDELFKVFESFHIDTNHFLKSDQTNCGTK